jgi:hypothetical protein
MIRKTDICSVAVCLSEYRLYGSMYEYRNEGVTFAALFCPACSIVLVNLRYSEEGPLTLLDGVTNHDPNGRFSVKI